MKRFYPVSCLVFFVLLGNGNARAGFGDWLEIFTGPAQDEQAAAGSSGVLALTQSEMVTALKQALEQGVQHAVQQLGQPGGFLDDARVHIPMPEQLQWTEKTLRSLGQDRLADEFVESMNHAAEQAVPEVASVFADAIRGMTLDDARAILDGPDNAATRYFQQHSSDALVQRMLPIVSQATDAASVTANYKAMLSKTGNLTSLLGVESPDLDGYVTRKAMDGLFLVIAEEEKKIRENPVERSTELLQKVFGSIHN